MNKNIHNIKLCQSKQQFNIYFLVASEYRRKHNSSSKDISLLKLSEMMMIMSADFQEARVLWLSKPDVFWQAELGVLGSNIVTSNPPFGHCRFKLLALLSLT